MLVTPDLELPWEIALVDLVQALYELGCHSGHLFIYQVSRIKPSKALSGILHQGTDLLSTDREDDVVVPSPFSNVYETLRYSFPETVRLGRGELLFAYVNLP